MPYPPGPVVLVADSREDQDFLGSTLEREGIPWRCAPTLEAEAAQSAAGAALLIVSTSLHRAAGEAFFRFLEKASTSLDVPVLLVIDSSSSRSLLARALEAGAFDYVTKPIHAQVLVRKLRVFLELHEARTRLREQARIVGHQQQRIQNYSVRIHKKDESLRLLIEARNALLESQHQFLTLVNNIPGAAYRRLHDAQWTVRYLSKSISELSGRRPADIAEPGSVALISLIHPEDLERTAAAIASAIAEHSPFRVEYRMIHRDGGIRWVQDRGRATLDPAGAPCWIDGAIFDITQQRASEEALRLAKEAAERSSRLRSEFLANMSHELRTPLHAILSFARFGQRKGDTADRQRLQEYFSHITHSGELLLTLVNNLLDLAKLEAGRFEYDIQPRSLERTIRSALVELSQLASDKGIRLALEPQAPDAAVHALFDAERIQQVLRNLLGNALKLAPPRSAVEVRLERAGEVARVSVLDEGPGIPPDELESIFDQFVQSRKTRTGAGGTGLGLAICRSILEGHRGRIWAENRPEGGAKLSFELPLAPAPTAGTEGHGCEEEAPHQGQAAPELQGEPS